MLRSRRTLGASYSGIPYRKEGGCLVPVEQPFFQESDLTIPLFDEDGAPLLFDTYGVPVTEPRPRLRDCRCEVPCLGFTCISSHHRGPRAAPWCCGGEDDDLPPQEPDDERDAGRCAACWVQRERNPRVARARRRVLN